MPNPQDRVGLTLAGKYELRRVLGSGGMGVVYEALNALTGRRVAVKLLSHAVRDRITEDRLLREAQAASSVHHPNVVDVLDAAMDAELGGFLVMELLDGEALDALLDQKGRLTFEETAAILGPVMEALEVAHEIGVVHRDLKPSNIFLHVDARGTRVPKLVDFGIARAAGPRVTETGMSAGTPGYMAPEQMMSLKSADRRSDVWSLGVIVHECLTGTLPVPGGTELAALAPNTPRAVTTAVQRALSILPDQRPASALEFARALGFVDTAAVPADLAANDVSRTVPGAGPSPLPLEVPSTLGDSDAQVRTTRTSRWVVIGGGVVTAAALTWVAVTRGDPEALRGAALQGLSSTGGPLAPRVKLPLPKLEYRAIEGGVATLGSTSDETRAARAWCLDETARENCPEGLFEAESPERTLELRAFKLGRHEVTNTELFAWLTHQDGLRIVRDARRAWLADSAGQLLELASESARHLGISVNGAELVLREGFGERATVGVTQRLARRFCESVGGRLPTSAEWEWAARGVTRRRFPWGNALFACHRAVAARSPGLACADKPPGPQSVLEPLQDETSAGIVGLAGNVAEWVSDAVAPAGGAGCATECFAIRGGDWYSPSWVTRTASRRVAEGAETLDWLGFRCAEEAR